MLNFLGELRIKASTFKHFILNSCLRWGSTFFFTRRRLAIC